MKTYAGIDLHSSNNYIGIINEHDQRLYGKRIPNQLDRVLMALEPFRDTLQGVVVESTYNWYWLVDGLQEHGYRLHLANPAAVICRFILHKNGYCRFLQTLARRKWRSTDNTAKT